MTAVALFDNSKLVNYTFEDSTDKKPWTVPKRQVFVAVIGSPLRF